MGKLSVAPKVVLVHHGLIPVLTRLVEQAAHRGIAVTFVSGYRDKAAQQRLWDAWVKRGRTGIAPAPPGRSLHQRGLAVDFDTYPRTAAARRIVGVLAEGLGLRWGGRFQKPDPIHLDVGFGSSFAS